MEFSTETILAVIVAIMAGGYGLFNNLARRKVEGKLSDERKRQRRGLRKAVDKQAGAAETALERYERLRSERIRKKLDS